MTASLPSAYAAIIATLDRPESLARVFASLQTQEHRPTDVVVVDASAGSATRELVHRWTDRLPVQHVAAARRSSAAQRNLGASLVDTPLVAFLDDDIEFPPEHFARLTRGLETHNAIGISGREAGMTHPAPRGALRLYYRLQAGYADPHYGARLLGPALNHVPCYDLQPGPLVRAEWLPSTCVVYRRESFAREQFPDFDEYSFMEDVHLSARLARQGPLYFHAEAVFVHRSGTSGFKRNIVGLARHRVQNRARVAREALHLRGWRLGWRLALYRLFVTAALARSRPRGWMREIAGTWI